ncbi:hypothetical protein KDL01_20560 [Actinospica durhamensis]|uniref:Uncharacterized protein n=1 Tax=Actinospica durhamensis TaxID=1508375 RepID=A0A941INQ9_9ACTN|nr:hypothetical protein [Actinospica durhamensis]MBR7835680.1 hypothetical protein [Actinospica durhamensis]
MDASKLAAATNRKIAIAQPSDCRSRPPHRMHAIVPEKQASDTLLVDAIALGLASVIVA